MIKSPGIFVSKIVYIYHYTPIDGLFRHIELIMAKKLIFIFAGTGRDAEDARLFYKGEIFNHDVIVVYFNGCQDERVGGRFKLVGYLSPNLEVVSQKIREAFSKKEDATQLSIAELKRQFGDAIQIASQSQLMDTEVVDDITISGFSRGGVTTFAVARALNDLDTPISLLAIEPVPGEDRENSRKEDSLHRKNFDLGACGNILRAEILLGTYSKDYYGFHNRWFRQMAPKLPSLADDYIYIAPKASHFELNNWVNNHVLLFFHQRGLMQYKGLWSTEKMRAFVIPKVEQQKFHDGVVGRTQYLPTYKKSLLAAVRSKYENKYLCPVNEQSKFKFIQALLVLHHAAMDPDSFEILSKAVLADTNKGKGLREFLVEFNSIVQYSKEKDTLTEAHQRAIVALEQGIYHLIARFQQLDNPTRAEREIFVESVQVVIKQAEANLPGSVFKKLNELTILLLSENTLVHPHLVQFVDENETCDPNELTASEHALDGMVTNAKELAQKLFHSSARQRPRVFEQIKHTLPQIINTVADLVSIAPFLSAKPLGEALNLVGDRMKSMGEVLSMMQVLPTYAQRKIVYHAYKDKFADMQPCFTEIVALMDYLSYTKCKELCTMIPIGKLPDFDITYAKSGMLSSDKMELLRIEANVAQLGIR